MSHKPANRPLRLPPANLAAIRIPRTRQPARNWFRLHQLQFPAASFSLNASHRYSHKDCLYQLLYLGVDTDTCLFERFGDSAYDNQKAIARSLWDAHGISIVQLPELDICDLTHARTLSALAVDLSALMHTDVATPQAWGLAIQRHPAHFQAIKFRSRFNGKACLALFKRDGIEKRLREKFLDGLAKSDAAVDWLETHKASLY